MKKNISKMNLNESIKIVGQGLELKGKNNTANLIVVKEDLYIILNANALKFAWKNGIREIEYFALSCIMIFNNLFNDVLNGPTSYKTSRENQLILDLLFDSEKAMKSFKGIAYNTHIKSDFSDIHEKIALNLERDKSIIEDILYDDDLIEHSEKILKAILNFIS